MQEIVRRVVEGTQWNVQGASSDDLVIAGMVMTLILKKLLCIGGGTGRRIISRDNLSGGLCAGSSTHSFRHVRTLDIPTQALYPARPLLNSPNIPTIVTARRNGRGQGRGDLCHQAHFNAISHEGAPAGFTHGIVAYAYIIICIQAHCTLDTNCFLGCYTINTSRAAGLSNGPDR